MIAWIDCSVGAAGDMLLAALIDAGADADRVRAGLAGLGIPGWKLELAEVRRGAFRGLHARFVTGEADGHVHRPWREVRAILERAALPERARARALAAYGRLALAEAALHGVAVDDVELHEVGALDAILDVVGVCLALEDLGVDEIVADAPPLGAGQTQGAHGRIPLPAPATLSVLKKWPVTAGPPGEWITPTAAALIATLGRPGGPPAMVLGRTGHGAGTRNPPHVANLVRVVLGEVGTADAPEHVVELACNVDDQPGQHLPPLIDRLMADGALDAWATPVHMKKGRPGLVVSVLCRPGDADRLSDVLLRHSSTLGVRRHTAVRTVLDRWFDTVDTPYGPVRIKVGGRDGRAWHAAPEHEDVAARAAAAEVPLHEVHAAAMAAWRNR